MRKVLAAVGLVLSLALAGCGGLPSTSQITTIADDAYAKVTAGDLAGLKAMSTPELQAQLTPEVLTEMRRQIPNEKQTKVELNAWQANSNVGAPSTAWVKRVYSYPSSDVLVTTVLQKGADKRWALTGIHVLAGPPGVGAP